MKFKLPESVTRFGGKVLLQAQKSSPQILAITGTVGVIAGVVLACKQTTKVSDILEKHKEDVVQIKKFSAEVENGNIKEDYTEKDKKKDLTIVYTKTAIDIAKLYAVPAVMIAGSLGCLLGSNHILKVRYEGMAAAYTALHKTLDEYRSRVADRIGEEAEKEAWYNVKAQVLEKTGEDGKTEVETIRATDSDGYSPYAKFFDESCFGWEKDPEANLMFLRQQQAFANDLLRTKGWLTLNDVYRALGIKESNDIGMVVGWVYDEYNPVGDNYIDFGIYNVNRPKNRDFVNGYEPVILLDFNVDGNIYEIMKERKKHGPKVA